MSLDFAEVVLNFYSHSNDSLSSPSALFYFVKIFSFSPVVVMMLVAAA